MARQAIGAGVLGPVYINETATKQAIAAPVVYVNETVAAPVVVTATGGTLPFMGTG
jgi:hypothetical protein